MSFWFCFEPVIGTVFNFKVRVAQLSLISPFPVSNDPITNFSSHFCSEDLWLWSDCPGSPSTLTLFFENFSIAPSKLNFGIPGLCCNTWKSYRSVSISVSHFSLEIFLTSRSSSPTPILLPFKNFYLFFFHVLDDLSWILLKVKNCGYSYFELH